MRRRMFSFRRVCGGDESNKISSMKGIRGAISLLFCFVLAHGPTRECDSVRLQLLVALAHAKESQRSFNCLKSHGSRHHPRLILRSLDSMQDTK